MRPDLAKNAALTAFLLILLSAVTAVAQDAELRLVLDQQRSSEGHDQEGTVTEPTAGLDMKRVRRLESHIMCGCTKENWTRTLSGCPDGCADPQKVTIRERVMNGWSDEEIMEEQVGKYGERVRAAPKTLWPYLLPLVMLVAGMLVAVAVVRRSKDSGELLHAAGSKLDDQISDEELRRVELELEELE